MNENPGTKLASIVDEITANEILKAQVLYAKFQNSLKDSYEQKIKAIENRFIGKASFYGKNEIECAKEKNSILEKYEEEFQKIYDSRRVQYINIQNEIQELVANNLIIIANFKQIAVSKMQFINSSAYRNFLNQREEFQHIVDTTLNHAEFDKYTALLENLKDPLDVYQARLEALATKYDNYTATIEECEKKLDECLEGALADFEEIARYVENDLTVTKKQNIIMKFINQIVNKVTKGSGYQKNVVDKMENELEELEKDILESTEIIDEQTISIVAAIEEIRAGINEEFTNEFKSVAG